MSKKKRLRQMPKHRRVLQHMPVELKENLPVQRKLNHDDALKTGIDTHRERATEELHIEQQTSQMGHRSAEVL
jgi:hypothetical protein